MKPEFIDFDVVSMYVRPIKPLKLEKQNMTIEINKTYQLIEPIIQNAAMVSGYNTLTDALGEGEFIVETFVKSNWFDKAYILHARRLDTNEVEKIMVYEAEIELFKEVEETPIKVGKTYQLIEDDSQFGKTVAMHAGWRVLKGIFGFAPFTVKTVKYHNHQSIFEFTAVNESGDNLEAILYPRESVLLEEVSELGDPIDLLCKPVQIKRPFNSSICGWVTDQWIEDGVELLNVVHCGSFTVVPRSMVVEIFN
ncbi:Transcription regulator MotB domain-containing protein [Escherichia phage UPEC01]|nr:Transcription regulator MotB domain-containing protein [Escherichia phage UPEC01]